MKSLVGRNHLRGCNGWPLKRKVASNGTGNNFGRREVPIRHHFLTNQLK